MLQKIWQKITNKAVKNQITVNLADLEENLLMANISLSATQAIISTIKENSTENLEDFRKNVGQHLLELLTPLEYPIDWSKANNNTSLIIGINGSGKTTSIAKLCNLIQKNQKSVMLAAGDTFRAAAVEQLQHWGKQLNVDVISQDSGADSAAVIYDAMSSAKAKNCDVLLADTSGRLHNNDNLMRELERIVRVMKKFNVDAPQNVFLVCDATSGSNLIQQVEQFNKLIPITALIYTKTDILEKCGSIISVANDHNIPIAYIGTGEKLDNIRPFSAKIFVDGIVGIATD